ncbi:MAG TPA: UV DNA damage repair endonuclease UvsE [Oscillospiraceae bacterium]|nr:UV DNA damage repair endonuclease UvsE [Oscillospiraceae bacterium]HRW56609.1 UV DNA damage repair endonuclease UvsE [Oscillospiraceae bacterium]
MSIGYACLAVGVPDTDIKGCLLKNAGEEKLTELIRHNLTSLKKIIAYNDENGIRLFRISSDIIPFGSGPVHPLPWADLFREELSDIGENIEKAGIRVSMHPGQYTVLNSPEIQVAERAKEDLRYHAAFLESLGAGSANKIILHVGGVYGDKKTAVQRFSERYRDLDESVRRRLVLENDDRSYHIGDVLELGAHLGIPVVYDNLHNRVNGCDPSKSDAFWISQCAPSWSEKDGRQKVHYSQQARGKNAGSHSGSIAADEFLDFFASLEGDKPDIMLEVKDKNLSAVKCINCTAEQGSIGALELEWGRYKYAVLEKAPDDYRKIRELLKEKSAYPALAFYHLIEHAYAQEAVPGNAVNAALHVWGYFKNSAAEGEKKRFFSLLENYEENGLPVERIKRFLSGLTEKYRQEYLRHSYYFL